MAGLSSTRIITIGACYWCGALVSAYVSELWDTKALILVGVHLAMLTGWLAWRARA